MLDVNAERLALPVKNLHRKFWFSSKAVWTGLIFLLSLAFRYQDFYVFREFNADKAHQLHAAYELTKGRGVSLQSYDLNAFQAHDRPLLAWPPEYSYLVAGISKITGFSVYRASWAVDVLSVAGLWCVLFWFTVLLRFSILQTAVLFLLAGFCRTPWVYLWSADALGTVLFLFSAALNVWFVQREKESRGRIVVAFTATQAILIAAMCFLKYSLLPAYVSLGLSLFSFSWKSKKKFYRSGFLLLSFGAISLVLLQLYNSTLSGRADDMGNLYQQQRGLFFGNLRMFSPFFLKSFIYIDGFLDKLNSGAVFLAVQLVNAALIFIVLFHAGKKILTGKADYFSHLVFAATVCVCGFLAVLSVAFGQQVFIGTYRWTYVKELRYFMPAAFLLLLYAIRSFQLRRPQTGFNFFAFAFVGSAALYGLALNGYYKLKGNRAGSFENLNGRILRANQFWKAKQDSNAYFLSLTGNSATDAQATSLAAINGAKVVISYDGIFPDAYLSPLFAKDRPLAHDKKVIIYIDDNLRIADSLNPAVPHRLEQNQQGEHFLLVNP